MIIDYILYKKIIEIIYMDYKRNHELWYTKQRKINLVLNTFEIAQTLRLFENRKFVIGYEDDETKQNLISLLNFVLIICIFL